MELLNEFIGKELKPIDYKMVGTYLKIETRDEGTDFELDIEDEYEYAIMERFNHVGLQCACCNHKLIKCAFILNIATESIHIVGFDCLNNFVGIPANEKELTILARQRKEAKQRKEVIDNFCEVHKIDLSENYNDKTIKSLFENLNKFGSLSPSQLSLLNKKVQTAKKAKEVNTQTGEVEMDLTVVKYNYDVSKSKSGTFVTTTFTLADIAGNKYWFKTDRPLNKGVDEVIELELQGYFFKGKFTITGASSTPNFYFAKNLKLVNTIVGDTEVNALILKISLMEKVEKAIIESLNMGDDLSTYFTDLESSLALKDSKIEVKKGESIASWSNSGLDNDYGNTLFLSKDFPQCWGDNQNFKITAPAFTHSQLLKGVGAKTKMRFNIERNYDFKDKDGNILTVSATADTQLVYKICAYLEANPHEILKFNQRLCSDKII